MAVRWRALTERWLDLLFPPRCLSHGCSRRGVWICAPCLAAAPSVPARRCSRCGDGVLPDHRPRRRGQGPPLCWRCLNAPPAFALAVAPWHHRAPVADWIHALKYDRRSAVAEVLGRQAAAALRRVVPEAAWGGDACVVPVPTHPERRAERRIDVPALLAAAAAHELGLPLAAEALVRTRATPPQVGTSRALRLANVDGAFSAATAFRSETALLVDDVLTTGATADACARALLSAGAERVIVLTVARATHVAGPARADAPRQRRLHRTGRPSV